MQPRIPAAVMGREESYTSDTRTARTTTDVDLYSDRQLAAKSKRPAVDNSDNATHKRSKHTQEVRLRTNLLFTAYSS
jgi:hypothetical protein